MFGLTSQQAFITVCCAILVLIILYVVLIIQYTNLNKRYKKFMEGEDGKSLEASIKKRIKEIDSLNNSRDSMEKHLERLDKQRLLNYQKVSLHKYDAFEEMGGKLSFTLCMLDGNEDGFLLTSMHSSREGCYIYSKEIIRGEAFVLLSDDEKKALEEAKAKNI